MTKNERFKQRPLAEKIQKLLTCLNFALQDSGYEKRRTDVWGVAQQYGNNSGMKKDDFNLIKAMTVQEMVDIIIESKKPKI